MGTMYLLMSVHTRGCTKDPKSRRITQKYIYIQKRLIDEWMKASADTLIFS
jgi:hypothetical protein